MAGWQVPMAGRQVPMAGWQVPMAGWQVPMAGWKAEQNTAKQSLSTGASHEAPVDKGARHLNDATQSKAEQSKAKHSLSTGASRKAPVDNECFALVCSALLCILCLANLEGQAKWAKAIFEGGTQA